MISGATLFLKCRAIQKGAGAETALPSLVLFLLPEKVHLKQVIFVAPWGGHFLVLFCAQKAPGPLGAMNKAAVSTS